MTLDLMIRLSVIVPAYNVAPYIEAALLSVFHSEGIDLSAVEAVVVNDGSTDSTAGVVVSFIAAHPEWQIRLINQSNQGVSVARNNGLHAARGEYVWFVDGDDQITSTAIWHLYAIMDTYSGIEVIRTAKPVRFTDDTNIPSIEVQNGGECCHGYELFNEPYSNLYLCHVRFVWLREMLENHHLQYPAGITNNEDFCFTIQSLLRANKAYVAPGLQAYLYRVRGDSVTGMNRNPERFMPKILSAQQALRIILDSVPDSVSSAEENRAYSRVRRLMYCMHITYLLYPLPLSFVRRSLRSLIDMGAYPFTPEPDHSRLLHFVMQRKWAIYAVSQYRRMRYKLHK